MMRRRLLTEKPGTYRFIDWIMGTGSQYLNTGIIPVSNMTAVCTFSRTATYNNDQMMFGCRNGSGSGYSFYAELYRTSWYSASETSVYNNVLINVGTSLDIIHTVELTPSGFKVDNNSASPTTTQIGMPSVPIYIFAYNDNNNVIWKTTTTKIHNFKLYNNIVVNDFRPCVRIADNKPGLYDSLTDTFLINQGNGEFIIPT